MKRGCLLLSLGAALLGAGCSSSSSSGSGSNGASGGISDAASASFVGIYQTTDYTDNTASCDAPGASKLSSFTDKYFLAASVDVLGEKVLMIVSCNGVSDCQTKRSAVSSLGFYTSSFSYTLSSAENATTLAGFEATTGFGQGTTCTGRTYADHTLTLNADHSVTLQSRIKDLADAPQQDGFCEVEPAQSKAEAAKASCAELQVLTGTFVQAM